MPKRKAVARVFQPTEEYSFNTSELTLQFVSINGEGFERRAVFHTSKSEVQS